MHRHADEPAPTGLPPTPTGRREAVDSSSEFARLWRGFMTARSMVGLALLLFAVALYRFGQTSTPLLAVVTGLYLAAALAARLLMPPRPLGPGFGPRWLATAGVDLAAFTLLQLMQGHVVSLTPLYALPVLMAAVLGPLLTALGTAAAVTLLLLTDAAVLSGKLLTEAAPLYLQAALASVGGFAIAGLAHQLTGWLAREERQSKRHQHAARLQQEINALVIESTSDGVLVVDDTGTVHAANPAARQMLQADERTWHEPPFSLEQDGAWRALAELVLGSLRERQARQADLGIAFSGQGTRQVRVRTRLTSASGAPESAMCVVFLQDLRELEARLRTDRLASMGRMSAAVAHEIRNPLAAIVQANALLEEELAEPRQRQLTGMVRQNARRLESTVEDILDITRARSSADDAQAPVMELPAAVAQICADWVRQTDSGGRLRSASMPARCAVHFDPEHLRRVLVNLLDNARRYASPAEEAIEVALDGPDGGHAVLRVWSDGAPIEPSVERHLFEPFFSSESRSSGLGLYICRELCEGHGATIGYRRVPRLRQGVPQEGNEFFVSLRSKDDLRP